MPPPVPPGSRRPSSKVECACRWARASARRSSRSPRAGERCCRRPRHLPRMTRRRSVSFDISAPLSASCHGDPRVRKPRRQGGGAVGTPTLLRFRSGRLLCQPRRLSGWICTGALSAGCRRCCHDQESESPNDLPGIEKAPLCRAFPCAEEDSNLHPVNPDQALNLARLPIPPSARASGQYRARVGAVDLCPSTARATVHEHMFDWLPTKRGLAWT